MVACEANSSKRHIAKKFFSAFFNLTCIWLRGVKAREGIWLYAASCEAIWLSAAHGLLVATDI